MVIRNAWLDEVTTSGYSLFMKAVGIKALKARLSEYIRLAKAGETILVTERDEVVAELRPARRQPLSPGSLAESLASLADRGEATLASEPIRDWNGFEKRHLPEGISSSALLDELRRDTR